jgi:hypothetical protein
MRARKAIQAKDHGASAVVEVRKSVSALMHTDRRVFFADWWTASATNERTRIMTRSKPLGQERLRTLYQLASLVAARRLHSKDPLPSIKHWGKKLMKAAATSDIDGMRKACDWGNESQLILKESLRLGIGIAKGKSCDAETILGHLILEIMTSDGAPIQLRQLAKIVAGVPPGLRSVDFDNGLWGPDWFKPTLQDGLKAVMLGAFFDLMKFRLPDYPLPTIGELDSAIREKWKWSGGDKELRDARRELGLSGLPRGKSGRPKKQRGKR